MLKMELTNYRKYPLIFLSILSCILTACGDSEKTPIESVENVNNRLKLKELIAEQNLNGDASLGRALPNIEEPIAQLGKKLFFTKGLGGDKDSACVTCHHPVLGGGDNLSLSIGVGSEIDDMLGEGRFHDSASEHYDGGPTVPRNAPTTFNLGMWDKFMFHDGRVESMGKTQGVNGADGMGIRTPDSEFGTADLHAGDNLAEAQARFPVTSPEEMRGFIFAAGKSNSELRTELENRITLEGDWDEEFVNVFGDNAITYARIAKAIGEYERSQVFINTPFKAFLEGDDTALSPSAIRGGLLFFGNSEQGGANCASCHSGDFFTDEAHHVTASPQIGRGKGSDNGVTKTDDFGRFLVTKDPADMYRFRTPSLLNVEVTGPWGHAGANTTLEGAVRHSLNPAKAFVDYDFSQLEASVQVSDMQINTQFAVNQLIENQNNNVPNVLRNFEFVEQDVKDLVEFLHGLTDPCVKNRECLSPWVSEGLDEDPDGMRLNAIDQSGNAL
ncbi:cytochrome-c peroxidase [Paraglaciecola sp.]|uniref:cytochrome-c peroxidase n=1 Tax=Paraglaciecola sp. TaxID=1920173 RepID=UPI003EF2658A